MNFKFVTRIKSCVRGFIESTCNKNRFETFDNVNFTNIFQENSIRDVYTRAQQLLEISKRVLINFSPTRVADGISADDARTLLKRVNFIHATPTRTNIHSPFFPHIFFAAFSFVHSTYLRKYTHTHTHTHARAT